MVGRKDAKTTLIKQNFLHKPNTSTEPESNLSLKNATIKKNTVLILKTQNEEAFFEFTKGRIVCKKIKEEMFKAQFDANQFTSFKRSTKN
jgi:hypothetical protein